MEENMERRTIEAGTILKLNGIPILVTEPFEAEAHRNNWSIALEPEPARGTVKAQADPDYILPPPVRDSGPLESGE